MEQSWKCTAIFLVHTAFLIGYFVSHVSYIIWPQNNSVFKYDYSLITDELFSEF